MKEKQKNGFTLIELLAVIVILAIIALIAVPMILNVVEKARKGAAVSSAYGYIDAIEKYITLHDLDSTNYPYDLKGQTLNVETSNASIDNKKLNEVIKVKGDLPDSGTVTIDNKGKVTDATLTIGKYEVSCPNGKCSAGSSDNTTTDDTTTTPESTVTGPTKVNAVSGETHKGIVYLDPTDLTATCNETNSESTTGKKDGCMKWYIFDDSGDNYTMILDHNTTAKVAYETSGTYKEYAQASIKTQVEADTTGWSGSPSLITANEIAAITKNTGWDSATATSNEYFYFGSNSTTVYSSQTAEQKTKQQSLHWLFDYTDICTGNGCQTADSSTDGYWTQSPVSNVSVYAWNVDRDGFLNFYSVDGDYNYGVRPVITIQKSILN